MAVRLLLVRPLLEMARESHGAEEAADGAAGCVAAQVADQAVLLGEGPGAQVAAEGALARVDPQVSDQVALVHKGLAAVAALVRALARVHAPVVPQLARGRRNVAALLAVQLPATRRAAALHLAPTAHGGGRTMRWR